MFWINPTAWTYQPSFNFWNIDHLTYLLLPWDIFLLVMTALVIFWILWIEWNLSFSFTSDNNEGYINSKDYRSTSLVTTSKNEVYNKQSSNGSYNQPQLEWKKYYKHWDFKIFR